MEKNTIKTFILVDLESTGLPLNGKKIRLTELCFISVSRKSILECRTKDCIPRVKNKISFVVNPKSLIPDEVVDLTGIDNFMVEEEHELNEHHATLVKSFLKNTVHPVCLIAHNGFKFDFPLLKKELKNFEAIIPEHVLCADSYLAVRRLSNAPENGDQLNAILSATDLLLYEESERVENEYEEKKILEECLKIEKEFCSSTTQATNETTPVAQIISSACSRSASSTSTFDNVKRKLFEENLSPRKLKLGFKLDDIYKSLFDANENKAHEAEADASTLLKCIVKIGEPILKYFDDNAILFSDVKSFG